MKTWWRIGLVAVLAAIAGTAEAVTYAYRNDTFSYDTPSGSAATVSWHTATAAPACTNYPSGDDDWADIAFPSGFTFTFGGTSYSGVRVYSNGILAFGNDVSGFHRTYTPQALPITAAPGAFTGCPNAVPVNLMVAYWIDIVAGTANGTTGASVKYEVLGTAPNRRFVISWVNVKLYNQTARYNFQVALYESAAGVNGNFRYQYSSGSSDGSNATVGVQLSTTDYTQYSYNQQFIDTTNGTAILWYPANQLATKYAEYRFDESVWSGVANEIRDTSGNSRDASRVGGATSAASGKLCRGGSFGNNTANTTIDAVATPVAPGPTGSIDFWFKSGAAWNSADAMLLDATQSANRPFFLMKRSTGALRFAITDSAGTTLTGETAAQTFAAGTWHHVAVTWNIRAGSNLSLVQVYLDGVLATTGSTAAGGGRGTTTGTLGSVTSVYIGDNRTSGVTPTNGTPNGANGTLDEVYVYGIDISGPQIQADMNLTRATCTTLDHFHIVHNGNAICGSGNVTIEAHDQNHALFSLAGSTMSVSTSTGHGSWSAVSAINPVTNTAPGTAIYTFANENSVIFALSDSFVESVNINVGSGSITEHSYMAATCSAPDYTFGSTCDADLVFSPCVSSFECVASGLTYNNLTATPSARNPLYTQLAGTAFSFDVVAVDASGNRVTAYAGDADKTVTVELVDGAGATACASRTQRATTSLTFTKAGQPTDQGRKAVSFAPVSNAYANLRCRVTDANYATPVVACSSDNFAMRPQSLTVSSSMNADATGTSGTATPAQKVGGNFTLTATAVAGYDGMPQVDATKVAAHGGATSTGVLSGSFPAATPATGASSGTTFTYGEVGYFRFGIDGVYDSAFTSVDQPNDCTADFSNAAVSGKFGCSFGNTAATSYFGRFIPDHFTTQLTAQCGNFAYAGHPGATVIPGQPFGVTVTANNASGGTTVNYAGSYAKAINLSSSPAVGSLYVDSTAGGTGAVPAATFASGVGTVNYSVATGKISFVFGSFPYAATNIAVHADDADTGSSVGTDGTINIRAGRLRMSNAFGSAPPFRMPIEAQYWTGSSWLTNSADSCTTLAAGNILLAPAAPAWGVTAPTTLAGGGYIGLAPSGAGSKTVCADLGADHGVVCTATGAGLPWLQSKWPGAATYDNDPSATATFGIFSPEGKRGVYNREMY